MKQKDGNSGHGCVQLPGDIVDHERTSSTSVVAPCDSPKPLLASRVPDLKFDLLTTNFNYSGSKLYSNCMGAISHNLDGRKHLKLQATCQNYWSNLMKHLYIMTTCSYLPLSPVILVVCALYEVTQGQNTQQCEKSHACSSHYLAQRTLDQELGNDN